MYLTIGFLVSKIIQGEEMDERVNDYNNYDKLVLYVKHNKVEKIVKVYEKLGYELVEKKDNHNYGDTVDITFVRAHKIENKDALQLLQVNLEKEINYIGRSEAYKHLKSLSFATILSGLGLVFICLGILFSVKSVTLIGKILNACLCGAGLLLMFLCLIFTPKIINKENKKYELIEKQTYSKIDLLLQEVEKVRGEYEKI